MKRFLLVPALLACLSVVSFAQSDSAASLFDPPSGRYEQNLLVSLRGLGGEPSPARGSSPAGSSRLEYRVSGVGSSDFVGYEGPLRLTALPGEERTYRVTARISEGGEILREEEARYTIDRRVPPAPEISALSGFYREPVGIDFEAHPDATVYYAIDGPEFTAWGGNDIPLSGEAWPPAGRCPRR